MKSRSRQMLFPYPATLAAFLLYNQPFVTFLSWVSLTLKMLANISKLWAMYKPSKEFQPIVFSVIITGYFFYKLEFGGENAAERRAEEKRKRRTRPQHH